MECFWIPFENFFDYCLANGACAAYYKKGAISDDILKIGIMKCYILRKKRFFSAD